MKKEKFLTEVINQIKSKKAKKNVKAELEYHLNNSKYEWTEKGFSETKAEEMAVEQMGNPIKIGNDFNKLHCPWYIYFFKLNVVSLCYAFMAIFSLELIVNIYRISRITGLNIETVNTFVTIINFMVVIFGTLILYLLTKNWLTRRKVNFWTIILWVPYFVLFVCIVSFLFPISYAGDDPGIGVGLIALGAVLFLPIYILIINLLGYMSNAKVKIDK